MAKPAWMDKEEKTARGTGRLTEGGHKCDIKHIEVQKSKNGLDMYVIYFDTASDDAQPYYYKQYDREGKMWLVVDENAKSVKGQLYGRSNLARFTTSVEDSYEGKWQVDWTQPYTTDAFVRQFFGKRVGIVFEVETYTEEVTKELKSTMKPKRFRNVNKVEEEKPKPKEVKNPNSFMDLADDEGLPFNV